MYVYTVMLMDDEPETRKCGEFGHTVRGVYSTFEDAKANAENFKHFDHVIILESSLDESKIAKEVWRWDATNDEFCSSNGSYGMKETKKIKTLTEQAKEQSIFEDIIDQIDAIGKYYNIDDVLYDNNMDIYTLFGMDNEPYVLKAGEFGHEFIGVYTSLNEAREIASQPKYTDDYSVLVIYKSIVGGPDRSSKEVWRWTYEQDNG